jgi:hypothetical protein
MPHSLLCPFVVNKNLVLACELLPDVLKARNKQKQVERACRLLLLFS